MLSLPFLSSSHTFSYICNSKCANNLLLDFLIRLCFLSFASAILPSFEMTLLVDGSSAYITLNSIFVLFLFHRFFLFICLVLFKIDRVHILEDRSLRLENVGLDDMGEYTCEADNAVGAVASTGNLIVYGMIFFPIS